MCTLVKGTYLNSGQARSTTGGSLVSVRPLSHKQAKSQPRHLTRGTSKEKRRHPGLFNCLSAASLSEPQASRLSAARKRIVERTRGGKEVRLSRSKSVA
jgi:hypothetical protein